MLFKAPSHLSVMCCVLFVFLATTPQLARAGDFRIESAGARFGFASETGDIDFHQLEAFLDCDLPWGWDLGRKFWLQAKLDTSAGALGDSARAAAVLTAGPVAALTYDQFPVWLEAGISPTFISRHEFTDRNLGSLYQFTSHVGLNVDLGSHFRVSYRAQHMSNGGFAHPNPGLNMHVFGVSYLF
jgi:hypothetical protein